MRDPELLQAVSFVKDHEKFLNEDYYKYNYNMGIGHNVFVVDFREMKLLYSSKNEEEVAGFSYEEMQEFGSMHFYSLMHATDLDIINKHVYTSFMGFMVENKPKDISKIKFCYTVRLRQKNNTYKWVLVRYSNIMVAENGLPVVIMGTLSDISNYYDKNEIRCEILNHTNPKRPTTVFQRTFPILEEQKDFKISKTELEVLSLVSQGMISKQIAANTNRSIETIHSHRKNILKKLSCNNMTDAVLIAQKNEWI